MEGDDVAYLEAARTVDERAHSDAATRAFRAALGVGGGVDAEGDPVCVLEAGAGTCGLLRRLLAGGALPAGEWVAVDTDERVLSAGRDLLEREARAAGYGVDADDAAVLLGHLDRETTLRVRFETRDARDVASEEAFDGVVGRSFADLLAPEDVLALARTAAPDGWYHLPLTFDGETRFSPSHPADGAVVDAFHGSMRNRGRAATRVAEASREAGTPPAVDARSDWVVRGRDGDDAVGTVGDRDRGYPADEATFLRTVLDTVVASVRESGAVADATLSAWETERKRQLARGELGYVARNRDLFGRVP